MIADLINDQYNVRLITKNVMSVYSTNTEYTDHLIRTLKHSDYIVNNCKINGNTIISYQTNTINKYKNVFRLIKSLNVNHNKVFDYIAYFDICHILWMKVFQLTPAELKLLRLSLQLSEDKQIVITDYLDDLQIKSKVYSLLYHEGLNDKLIVIPFTDIHDALNCSTCQCYVKSYNRCKILPRFPSVFVNHEFKSDSLSYTNRTPDIYVNNNYPLIPLSYKYSTYDLLLICAYFIKILFIQYLNWRTNNNVIRLYTGLL